MTTPLQPHKPYAKPWQIVLMVIGFIVMTPIYVIVVMLLVSFNITGPIADNIDRAKFERVDVFSRGIYDQLVAKSGGSEKWEYSKKCDPQHTGWAATGEYTCETISTTKVSAPSVQVLNDIHKKYFSIAETSSGLKLKDTTVFHPGNFGIKFEVSSLINRYNFINGDNIECSYTIDLEQTQYDVFKSEYGKPIDGKGVVTITFNCFGTARNSWYK